MKRLPEGNTIAKKTREAVKQLNIVKGFDWELKLKAKPSKDKRSVMARETFASSQKSQISTNPVFVRIVSLLAEEQSIFVRRTFNKINNNQGTEPNEKSLKDIGFDSTEARNIIKIAKGIYDSQKELVENTYIPETKANINSVKKQVKNISRLIEKSKSGNKIKKLCNRKKYLQIKLNQHQNRLVGLQRQLSLGKFSVCFGTKKLLRQFNKNLSIFKASSSTSEEKQHAYDEYQNKKERWRFNRNSEVFYEGHAIQRCGNQKIKLIEKENGFDIEINIPKRLRESASKITTLDKGFACFTDINFGNNKLSEDLKNALKPIRKESGRKNGKSDIRNTTKYPISHRLKLVKTKNGVMGVQLITTVKIDKAEVISSRFNGAIGVDLNQHSIDWTLVDYYGNYKDSGSIPVVTQDKNSNQTTDIISKALKELLNIALFFKVPIYLEDLAFKRNSVSLKSKGKKFARMATNIPFAQFKELIRQKAFRLGISVYFVNPAFTSVMGLYKYMIPYGLNSGTAAGMVIARRGLGFKEKIPSWVSTLGFPLDDGDSTTSWKTWGRLSKMRKTIGKRNRHQFYALRRSQRVNCSNKAAECTPTKVNRALFSTEKALNICST